MRVCGNLGGVAKAFRPVSLSGSIMYMASSLMSPSLDTGRRTGKGQGCQKNHKKLFPTLVLCMYAPEGGLARGRKVYYAIELFSLLLRR